MAIRTQFDASQWVKYFQAVQAVAESSIPKQRELLNRIGNRFISRIHSRMNDINLDYTSSYRRSLKLDKRRINNKTPQISISIIPTGEGAHRLPIYWKVLEFGSQPNPNVPISELANWGARKLNNTTLGVVAAHQIREVGTRPKPVLNEIFILSSSGQVLDISNNAKQIVEKEGQLFLKELEGIYQSTFTNRGRTVSRFRGPSGRFVKG